MKFRSINKFKSNVKTNLKNKTLLCGLGQMTYRKDIFLRPLVKNNPLSVNQKFVQYVFIRHQHVKHTFHLKYVFASSAATLRE